MGIELLTSILRIKTHVKINAGCCFSFQLTAAMVKFDSSIYSRYETKEVKNMLDILSRFKQYVVHCWKC